MEADVLKTLEIIRSSTISVLGSVHSGTLHFYPKTLKMSSPVPFVDYFETLMLEAARPKSCENIRSQTISIPGSVNSGPLNFHVETCKT